MSSSICDSCHAGCCRAYRLIITVYDLVDLVNSLGMKDATKGVCFEPIPFNLNYTANKNLMFPFIFDNQDKKGKMFSLALKKVESKIFPGTLKCHFLEENERKETQVDPNLPNHKYHPGSRVEGRCSVYEDRPTMCRAYPIGHNPISKISVLKKRDNLPQAQNIEAYQICPKQSLEMADFGLTDSKSITKKYNDMLLNDARIQAHNEIVLKWNSQPERLLEKVIPFLVNMVNSSIVRYQEPPKAKQQTNQKPAQQPSQKQVQQQVQQPIQTVANAQQNIEILNKSAQNVLPPQNSQELQSRPEMTSIDTQQTKRKVKKKA